MARLRGHVHGEGGRGGGPEGGARRAGLSSQINTNGIAPSNGNSSRFGEQDVPAKLPASAGSPPCGRAAPRRPPLSRGVPPVCPCLRPKSPLPSPVLELALPRATSF